MRTSLTAPIGFSGIAETPDRHVIPTASNASSPTPQSVAAAVLFREILEPLANGLGPVGEIALGAVADELFARKPR